MTVSRHTATRTQIPLALLLFTSVLLLAGGAARAEDNPNDTCLACHGDKTLTTKRAGRTVSLFVEAKKFSSSIHGSLSCTNCHADLEGKDLPHDTPLKKVNCGTCHSEEAEQHAKSLHGKAVARGDALAPRCVNCHGNHDILPVKDPRSPVAPLKVPFVCGKCHREGTPVQTQRHIEQHNILENYTESIHGEGLLKKGLIVAANCASCHTAHSILPHTDPNSSIARAQHRQDLHQVPRRDRSRCTARSSAANCGRKKATCCRRASTATSRTRSGMSSTPRAWPTPTACAATPIQTLKAARRPLDVRARRRSWPARGTPRWPAASATRR